MKRYNIINNSLGWFCFLVAAVTYLLTIEPTASFWDCPEFITQGFKLEVGHPPGNPIFMLTARFFVTIFGGGPETAAVAVNSMSALLSAGTILLLFWTITHLTRRLLLKDADFEAGNIPAVKMVLIMVAGVCGSLVYTWSDTFWFSAVEGEVYAFSSFCTALVFWLILKWENRADNPGSDRYLVLIAYIIGVSIAVHLLNLLCIPAIVLVIYFRKFKHTNFIGSLIALGVSVVLIVLILYGLVPGFISVAQRFEVLAVNTFGLSYNIGVLLYAIITLAVFIWTIIQLRSQKSAMKIKIGIFLSIILSGMPFIGHSWFVPTVLVIGLAVYLWGFCKNLPVRVFNVIIMSIFVIFIGYSSYALLLIRSTANTPMNQNAPDNVFDLGSYLNREQYGDTPLLNGPMISETFYQYSYDDVDDNGKPVTRTIIPVDQFGQPIMASVVPVAFENGEAVDLNKGEKKYVKVAKVNPGDPDRYVREGPNADYKVPDGMSMLFSRMYSDRSDHVRNYKSWSLYEDPVLVHAPQEKVNEWLSRGPALGLPGEAGYAVIEEIRPYLSFEGSHQIDGSVKIEKGNNHGTLVESPMVWSPGFGSNLAYFMGYQLNHMYWRYFMWNFAGRQNDLPGNGEPHLGNWISGIPALDNLRLGDQSELPEEFGEGNPGHNVFYMLPLLLGLLGIIWQSVMNHVGGSKRGIEQFWIVFFLFFMTGVAIVLYLNQPPCQPRERDYAFAGSFYAFSIWIGLGVPGLAMILKAIFGKIAKLAKKDKEKVTGQSQQSSAVIWGTAVFACLLGIFVPLQMVSQTWDDHDRSNRYAARDFGMNYLNSLAPNAIIFVNGDNDTFPLWYAQEVEGVRTDVKVINLSYLSQDWYARQVASATYDAAGAHYMMPDQAMAYNRFGVMMPYGNYVYLDGEANPTPVVNALQRTYATGPLGKVNNPDNPKEPYEFYDRYVFPPKGVSEVYAPLDSANMMKVFGALPADSWNERTGWSWNMTPPRYITGGYLTQMLTYDIIATSASEGFRRPVYFASTVGREHTSPYVRNLFSTGMAQMVTPFDRSADDSPVAAFGYCNIVGKFRFGGLDSGKKLYLDDTVRRMVTSTRYAISAVVGELLMTPSKPAPAEAIKVSTEKGLPAPKTYLDMAANLLNYMAVKMPASVASLDGIELTIAPLWCQIAARTGDVKALDKASSLIDSFLANNAKLLKYAASIRNNNAMFTNLMRAERYNLRRALAALADKACIECLRSQLSLPADSEERLRPDELESEVMTFDNLAEIDDAPSYDALKLVFMAGATMDDLMKIAGETELDQYTEAVIRSAAVMLQYLAEAKVDPATLVSGYLSKAGIKSDIWNKIITN